MLRATLRASCHSLARPTDRSSATWRQNGASGVDGPGGAHGGFQGAGPGGAAPGAASRCRAPFCADNGDGAWARLGKRVGAPVFSPNRLVAIFVAIPSIRVA